MRIIFLISILLLFLLISFSNEIWQFVLGIYLFIVKLSYDQVINTLVAIGTIATAIGAFWFGLFGNYETKVLLKKNELELDKEAFQFLSLITTTTNLSDLIDKFENIASRSVISRKKSKKYAYYINLADQFNLDGDSELNKDTFYKIKRELHELRKEKIDRETKGIGLLKFSYVEATKYATKNVFLIEPNNDIENHPPLLIYADSTPSGDSATKQKDYKKVYKLIDREFKIKNGFAETDNIYTLYVHNSIGIIYPEKDYKLIEQSDCLISKFSKIKIIYKNKLFILKYKIPQLFK